MKTLKGAMTPKTLMMMVVLVLLFASLIGVIADFTIGIAGTGNVTGATGSLVALLPLGLAIVVLVALFKSI